MATPAGATARNTMQPLECFAQALEGPDVAERLRAGVIGDGLMVDGPFGPKPLLYADYVASGRALRQVETFIQESVLPYYANSHTQGSFCGAFITALRRAARQSIADIVGAGEDCSVIFCGSGATAGINRLVGLFGIAESAARGERPLVIIGPYEHHSNILPWRESGAEVVEIAEAPQGGPDLGELENVLRRTGDRALRIGSFSAASNVTGIITDVGAVTACLKRHGALSVWDYAGGAPYLDIAMSPAGAAKDAVVLSPHKFVGGPGASGVLVVRNTAVRRRKPVWPGGGTVSFVSAWGEDYASDVAAREEGGTPNVIGDIRAALVLIAKAALGQDFIDRRNAELDARALAVWRQNPHIELLGVDKAPRLPIFSFRVRAGDGTLVHHQLFTRMLSDCYGVQARGGCACAGPYAHRLLGIDRAQSEMLRAEIDAGHEIAKPGWVRLNLSYLLDDAKADAIIDAVDRMAREAGTVAERYVADTGAARFSAAAHVRELESPAPPPGA